jgi:hypothetical protein
MTISLPSLTHLLHPSNPSIVKTIRGDAFQRTALTGYSSIEETILGEEVARDMLLSVKRFSRDYISYIMRYDSLQRGVASIKSKIVWE